MNSLANASHRPILLIRGLLRETRHWGEFASKLKIAFPQREIITYDIAGNGPRHHEKSATSISEMVDDLKSQLSDHQANANITPAPSSEANGIDIIAISMGGMITLEWMNKYPNDIHSAILINASLSNYSPFYKRLRWQQYKNILQYFFLPDQKRESLIFEITTRQSPPCIIENWIRWRKDYPVSASNAIRQLYAASRYQYHSIPELPTLLIGSQQDALVAISCSKALAKGWNIPLMIHPEAGHDLPSDDANWLLDKVELFYQRQAVPLQEHECKMN